MTVPNFAGGISKYNRFYLPQLKRQKSNHQGVFSQGDMIIDECLFRGSGIDVILNCYRDENLISAKTIREGFHEFLKAYKKAEEKWDIKISDFLEKKNIRLFSVWSHPGKDVLAEIGKRILEALEIEENVQFDWEFEDEYPILACVSKALGIEEYDFIRNSKRHTGQVLCNHRMDLEEYVREYIYWIHEYDLTVLFSRIRHIVHNKKFIFYDPSVYVRQLLSIMKESIIDTIDAYQCGMPVVILLDLNAKIRIQRCISSGIRIEDIYAIVSEDQRRVQLANLLCDYHKVVIYGMGSDFKFLIDGENDKIAVCDKNITEDFLKGGIEYITTDTLIRKYKESIVYVTSTMYGTEIQDELISKGFPKERIVLNKTCASEISTPFSNVEVVPLIKSKIWEENFNKTFYTPSIAGD